MNYMTVKNIFTYQMAVTACDQFSDYHGSRLSEDGADGLLLHYHISALAVRKYLKEKYFSCSGLGRGQLKFPYLMAYQIKDVWKIY